eukprot:CAMPEP_0171212676 /NCGR_PEP_ID=MMETSP0790-20130122/30254_1 /TAXON_ID=2925 /ORGANISM="Alexandrium catenella, Strain OF101" /LENGTH=270 /DNA_ID=CAMNT_0011678365 /DNA_START=117 /DNA_END=929 /DNA_ORIENTATION=+
MAEVPQVPPGQDSSALNASEMQANLSSAKDARKRAELDAQLLANRIALLKQEEEKAWKKIEETRKKAGEIMELRKQNEEKFAAKEDFYKNKWESIRAAQAQNAMTRDKAKALRDQTRQGLMEQKHKNATDCKMQSAQILQHKKEREAAERQQNTDRSNYVKAAKDQGKQKMQEDRLMQLEKFREDYEGRTAQEELLRARTDALVAKMEKEEMELIQRLQNTQTVQHNAYQELQAALGQTNRQITNTAHKFGSSARSGGSAGDGDQPQPAA